MSDPGPGDLYAVLRRQIGRYAPGRAREAAEAILAAHEFNQHRRAAALKHPDLAARLTQPPLSWSRPERWNGYIPPRMWQESPNDSPRRVALVEIAAEAMARELAEEIHDAED